MRVCENHAGFGILFGDLRLEKNFLSQFVQVLLEFLSLGLKAELKLKLGVYSWQKYICPFLEKRVLNDLQEV